MRHHRSARRAIHAVHIGVVAALVTILLPVAGSSRVAHASPTPWVPNGPGEFTSDSDGSTTPAQMTYDNHGVDPTNTRFSEREWSFSTTAASTIADVVPYFYTGFHAYFHVTVHIDAFVTHNGVTTTTSLAADGPTDCCIAPSGGFTYSGTHLFDVEAGDTYGFSFGGANFDGDPRFNGTLTLAESPYTSGHTVASNTSWITALPLTTAGADGALLQPGEARWYKFPVQPDSQVQVDLTNLDQNFDLTMFRDIGQAFTTLTTTQDLTKLSAQFAGDAFSPSIYSPSIYSPSIYSPSIYSPSIYSPSIYSPSIYSPSIYSPSDEFLTAFSSAQTRSLIGVSAHENTESESIRSATWNNTGDFYVRVQGRNGCLLYTSDAADE